MDDLAQFSPVELRSAVRNLGARNLELTKRNQELEGIVTQDMRKGELFARHPAGGWPAGVRSVASTPAPGNEESRLRKENVRLRAENKTLTEALARANKVLARVQKYLDELKEKNSDQ